MFFITGVYGASFKQNIIFMAFMKILEISPADDNADDWE